MLRLTSAVLFLLVFVETQSSDFDKPLFDSSTPVHLKFVTAVEGKTFFADYTIGRNWTEAGEFCTSLGLKLAAITSKVQDNALKAAYGPDFEWGHWTSGRDAQLPRQFSWNATGEAISYDYPELRSYDGTEYQTCLFYWSRPDKDSALYYRSCSGKTGVLCST